MAFSVQIDWHSKLPYGLCYVISAVEWNASLKSFKSTVGCFLSFFFFFNQWFFQDLEEDRANVMLQCWELGQSTCIKHLTYLLHHTCCTLQYCHFNRTELTRLENMDMLQTIEEKTFLHLSILFIYLFIYFSWLQLTFFPITPFQAFFFFQKWKTCCYSIN